MASTATTSPSASSGWNLSQYSWALYECARNPFYVLINIYVFSAYFSTVVISDPVKGQATWGYVLSTAAIVVACLAPILGAFADAGGRRKPWLASCILLAIPSIAVLAIARPDMQSGLGIVILALILANVGYELSSIFFNALLPQVVEPNRFGSLSGLAYAFANGAGILLFGVYLAVSYGLDLDPSAHWGERGVPIAVAIWFLIFALPILWFVPDVKSATSRPAAQIIGDGFRSLAESVQTLKVYPQIGRYLLARMVFNEGFIILMMFLGVFSAGILHWSAIQLSMMGLVLSVVAVGGSLAGGYFDHRLGSKAALYIAIAGSVVTNVMMVTIDVDRVLMFEVSAEPLSDGLYPRIADRVFFFAMSLGAFFVTAGLVSSRALLAKITPEPVMNRMFGLYALSGTATSFAGPLVIALLTQMSGSQHVGLTAGIVFLLLGMLLLARVQEAHSVTQ